MGRERVSVGKYTNELLLLGSGPAEIGFPTRISVDIVDVDLTADVCVGMIQRGMDVNVGNKREGEKRK